METGSPSSSGYMDTPCSGSKIALISRHIIDYGTHAHSFMGLQEEFLNR